MRLIKKLLFVLIVLSFTTLSFAAKKQTCEIPPSMKELAKDLASNPALESEFKKSSPDKVKGLGEAWVFFNKRKDKNKTDPKVLTAYVSMTKTLNSSNAAPYKKPAASNGFVVNKKGEIFSTKSKIFVNIDKGMFSNNNIGNLGITKDSPDSLFYTITDKNTMMEQIELKYTQKGISLHPDTRALIYNYISKIAELGTPLDQSKVGVPGTHAEVLALNDLYNEVGGAANVKQGYIQTFHSDGSGDPFPACANCASIIPSNINILTGKK